MVAKIPFAVRRETGEIVEVGDVPRGQHCGCLCPSCGQGVLGRHGEVNVWHFAHDSNSEDKPRKECDISFDSCCRQFAISMMISGDITQLRTPDWILTDHGRADHPVSVEVTQGRILEGVDFREHKRFDVATTVSGRELCIHFDYSGRHSPDFSQVDSGVLSVDLGVVKQRYYSQKSESGLIHRLIKELIEQQEDSKEWLHHPFLERARAKLKREAVASEASSPKTPARDNGRGLHNESVSMSFGVKPQPELIGSFSCVMCGRKWRGASGVDRDCPSCGTHLYGNFIPD